MKLFSGASTRFRSDSDLSFRARRARNPRPGPEIPRAARNDRHANLADAPFRLFILSSLVLLAILSGGGVAFAASGTATDLFVGTATTGVGQPLPLEIDPSNVTVRNDGAIGLGYTYRAIGTARGGLPGNFSYEEHGYLFFGNPSDPSTFVGSSLTSAVFTLTPGRQLPVVRIVDTDPAAYRSGTETVKVSQLSPAARRSLGQLIAAIRVPPSHAGSVTYGYFTFTDDQGTFTGYSTPDSREFAIRITFVAERDSRI